MANPLDPENLPELIAELTTNGWARRTGVLEDHDIQAINSYIDSKRSSFKLSPVVADGVLAPNDHIRGDMYIPADLEAPAPELMTVVQMVKNLAAKLRESGYVIDGCQLHPTFFPALHFFRKHVDIYGNDGGVIVTFMFYVNEAWESRDGGNLIIYDFENRVLADFLPEPGSFVILLSRKIPHEVRMCKRERRSIAGWFHDRPFQGKKFS